MLTLDVTLTVADEGGTLTAMRADGHRVILRIVPNGEDRKPQPGKAVALNLPGCDELKALGLSLVRLAESFGAR